MLARFIVPLTTLQKETGNTGQISQILIKVDDPSQTDAEVARFNELFKGDLKAISIADFVSQFSINTYPQLKSVHSGDYGLSSRGLGSSEWCFYRCIPQ